jgi:DNA-binding response OmpR family regulator
MDPDPAVRRGGKSIQLLPREYRLLEYLMRHAGQVVTRTMLFEEVWATITTRKPRYRRPYREAPAKARRRGCPR